MEDMEEDVNCPVAYVVKEKPAELATMVMLV